MFQTFQLENYQHCHQSSYWFYKNRQSSISKKLKCFKEWLDNSIAFKYRNIAANIKKSRLQRYWHCSLFRWQLSDQFNSFLKGRLGSGQIKDVVTAIRKHGDNPDEYVESSYKISETKYTAWPEHIKISSSQPVLKTGAETFKIQPLSEGGRDE